MTTLAAFKRSTRPGNRLEVLRDDAYPARVGYVRPIVAVTDRYIHYDLGWDTDPVSCGLIAWPKARHITDITDTEITYRLTETGTRPGEFYVTLRLLPPGSPR